MQLEYHLMALLYSEMTHITFSISNQDCSVSSEYQWYSDSYSLLAVFIDQN